MKRNLKTIDSPAGEISYRISGDFDGPALIFIHGAVGDSRLFRYQLRYFGKRYKTIAIDLPGHGYSRGDRPGLDDFTDAVKRVMNHENVTSFILLGHSMGGCISLEIYTKKLADMIGLVLISTAPKLPVANEIIRYIELNNMDYLAEFLIGAVFSEKVDLLLEFARKGITDIDGKMIKNDVRICQEVDYTDLLQHIDVPVLVIANRGDNLIPWQSTAGIDDAIQDSRLVVYEFNGHVPFFEQRDYFNKTVDGFIEEIIGE